VHGLIVVIVTRLQMNQVTMELNGSTFQRDMLPCNSV